MIDSLCIVGGGNAGLMAALFLKKTMPALKIQLIASKKIGTNGVGEGSTEHWSVFTYATGIPLHELIQECGATFKIGIKFENWHGDGTSYVHSVFDDLGKMDPITGAPYTMMKLIGDGVRGEDMYWSMPISGILREPFTDYFQFHFDSEKLNSFLQKKCKEADIDLVDAEISQVELDHDGYIESVISSDGQKYSADFFIDSTGFKRVLASKLGAEWVNWSKYLPLNSAIAFQTPDEHAIPTYTLAKAMSSGWSWKSPVQGRFGNGYVFSDQFISEEKALEEIQKNYQDSIHIGRKINFVSGKVNHAWIKNCICIGLSSNFVEPLEASSIATTIKQLQMTISCMWNWERGDTGCVKKYNRYFDDMMDNVLDFIQLHYFTQRQDTEFWRWCKNEMTMTDFNKENIEIFKKNGINQLILPEDGLNHNYRIYDCLNWTQVMHGLRLFDIESIKKIYDKHYGHLAHWDEGLLEKINNLPNEKYMPHREVIEEIKSYRTEYKL